MPNTLTPARQSKPSAKMRLARAVRTVAQCSRGMVRAKSETELLSEVCRIAVEAGHYRFVWIGIAEHDAEHHVRPAAWYGHEDGFLTSVPLRWARSRDGMSPEGRTLRSGKATVVQDTAAESRFLPWREQALQRGYRSAVALALKHDDVTQGVLVIYSQRVEDFGKAEVELLSHLAESISYHGFEFLRANQAAQHAAEGLRLSERRYRSLVLAGAQIVWTAKADGSAATSALNWEELTGQEFTDASGAGFLDLVHPDDRERGRLAREHALASGGMSEGELRIRTRDGQYRHFLARAVPVKAEDGSVLEWVGTYTDITTRKQAEEQRDRLMQDLARREKEARCLYTIIETIGNCTSDGELLRRVAAVIPCLTDQSAGARITRGREVYQSDGCEETEWREAAPITVDGAGGGMVEIFYRSPPPLVEPDPFSPPKAGLVAQIAREVGIALQHRQSRDELRQAQKMDALGRLAGGVAHDFNNILTIITSYSELLLDGAAAGSAEHRRLEQIHKAALHAATLTRQLLSFTRRQVVMPVVLDLNAVTSDLAPMLRRLLRENIDLKLRLQPRLGGIKGDAGQMEQILLNLVINTRDAIAESGTVIITTEECQMAPADALALGLPAGPHVTLQVSDDGAGMDEAVRSHLFEPFFTTKTTGTGLGLSTVHGIVQQSGGAITVASEPEKGSTFTIYLPCAPASEATKEPAARTGALQPALHGGETVLVAEDQDDLRNMLAESLQAQGYKVFTAASGLSALQVAARETQIDVVVTDMVMPGNVSGTELVRRLRLNQPGLPVLFISGYPDVQQVESGPGTRSAFLLKPFALPSLALSLRRLLDSPAVQAAN
jgi:two-component system cell cycle sensor histidine kinase/response regulator CckA